MILFTQFSFCLESASLKVLWPNNIKQPPIPCLLDYPSFILCRVMKPISFVQTLISFLWALGSTRLKLGLPFVFVEFGLSKDPTESLQWKFPTLSIWCFFSLNHPGLPSARNLLNQCCKYSPYLWCLPLVIYHPFLGVHLILGRKSPHGCVEVRVKSHLSPLLENPAAIASLE